MCQFIFDYFDSYFVTDFFYNFCTANRPRNTRIIVENGMYLWLHGVNDILDASTNDFTRQVFENRGNGASSSYVNEAVKSLIAQTRTCIQGSAKTYYTLSTKTPPSMFTNLQNIASFAQLQVKSIKNKISNFNENQCYRHWNTDI